MTYIPKKTNKHIFWKELMYWGFEYEKPCYINDEIWMCIKNISKKLSKCITVEHLPDFFVCDIEYDNRFFLDKETKLGDIDESFRSVIIDIINHIVKKNYSNSSSHSSFLQDLDYDNTMLDITSYKSQINNVLGDLYFNNKFFHDLYNECFDNYLEFYLSTCYNMQLNIRFSTYDDFYMSGSYIEKDNIYFGINTIYIHKKQSDNIKTYNVSELSFH